MSEEFDKTHVDCYNYYRNRPEESELGTNDKILVIARMYKDFGSLLEDNKIEELGKLRN